MSVSKRKIFYISGFDPRGAGHYHNLYKTEAKKHADLVGAEINVSNRKKADANVSWDVNYTNEGKLVETEYIFLKWDDIIRRNWVKGPLKMLLLSLRTYWYYIMDGTFKKALFISWPPALSLIYPFILISIIFLAALFVGVIMQNITGYLLVSLAIAFIVIIVGGKLMEKLNAYWLMRLYIFYAHHARSKKEDYEKRIESFVETLKLAVEENDSDEVVFVSHSAGTIVFISVLARLLRKYPDLDYSKFKILTLGHCIPLLSFIPKAEEFQRELESLSTSNLIWLDVTAPADGVCFCLNGPFIGVCENENDNLKVISARFHKMFEESKYKKLKRDRFLTHFLYLMAADEKTDFNYFEITAGQKRLEEQFAHVESTPWGYDKFKLRRSK